MSSPGASPGCRPTTAFTSGGRKPKSRSSRRAAAAAGVSPSRATAASRGPRLVLPLKIEYVPTLNTSTNSVTPRTAGTTNGRKSDSGTSVTVAGGSPSAKAVAVKLSPQRGQTVRAPKATGLAGANSCEQYGQLRRAVMAGVAP